MAEYMNEWPDIYPKNGFMTEKPDIKPYNRIEHRIAGYVAIYITDLPMIFENDLKQF